MSQAAESGSRSYDIRRFSEGRKASRGRVWKPVWRRVVGERRQPESISVGGVEEGDGVLAPDGRRAAAEPERLAAPNDSPVDARAHAAIPNGQRGRQSPCADHSSSDFAAAAAGATAAHANHPAAASAGHDAIAKPLRANLTSNGNVGSQQCVQAKQITATNITKTEWNGDSKQFCGDFHLVVG